MDLRKFCVSRSLSGLIQEKGQTLQNEVVSFIRSNYKKYSEMDIQSVWSHVQNCIDTEMTKRPSPKISCKSGCSACCYIPVGLLDVEAKYYADKINSGEWEIDKETFNDHLKLDNDGDTRAKPCTFLKGGKCSIYAERPIVCRKHMVVNDPEKCDYAKLGEGLVLNRINVTAEAIWSVIASHEVLVKKVRLNQDTSMVQDISKYLKKNP